MKHFLYFLFFLIATQLFSQYPPTVIFAGGNICETTPFKLVFFDEFNGSSINTQKWLTYFPYGPNGSDSCSFCRTSSVVGNEKGHIFRDENIRVENGKLYIDVKQQYGSWYEFNKNYTSGLIQSKQDFTTYTKYEIRCKIASQSTGYWPAFWAFGWNTELDVFEFYQETDRFECSVHYWDNGIDQFRKYVEPGIDLSQDFHIYSVEYDKFFVNFYLDGVKKVTMSRYYNLDGSPVTHCNVSAGTYINNQEFPKYGNPLNVIANIGLYPIPAENLEINPGSMEIDYIRVYQRTPQPGLADLCNSFKLNGSSSLCFDNGKKDTLKYCFDGPIDPSSLFSTSSNLEITQNPAFDLIKKDTTININGITIDTFYFDTIKYHGCIKVTPKPNSQNEFGSITIKTNIAPCGPKTINLPIQIGIPFPEINTMNLDPCRGEIILKTLKYDHDTKIEWSIYSNGNLAGPPIISYTYQNEAYIELARQRIFRNSYFYIKLKVITKCGEREVVQKINLLDKDCKNIEYTISPNPSNGQFSIQLIESDMLIDVNKISVRNSITNELVFLRQNILVASDLNLNLDYLPNGNYIISLENLENLSFSKPLQIFK
jgi:beta-glucanase (GH16 family)